MPTPTCRAMARPAAGRSASSRRRRLGALVAAVAVLLATVACNGGTLPGSRSEPGSSKSGSGSGGGRVSAEAELRYGKAPVPHPDVTYQPDVVLVGGGGDSVRSVTADGLTWRIDPRADRADELAPGKVMFLTGRGVGRVLDLRPEGDDLAVTIGPVDITEVIRDGTFASDRPIPFDRVISYQAGEPFWADAEGEPIGTDDAPDTPNGPSGGKVAGRSAPVPQAGDRPVQPPPKAGGAGLGPLPAGGFNVDPTCCASGVGARFSFDREGIRLAGAVELVLDSPTGKFELVVKGGSIKKAAFQIQGGAGLRVELEGATNVGAAHNINRRISIPVDFTVPLGEFLGVPFSATVNQSVSIQTAFSAKDGNISAAGEFGFTGALGFGYENGSFGAQGPQGFRVKNSLTDSIRGISVGVNGLLLAYQARFHVGIGAFGFTTGLYVGLTASVGVTVGSAAGAPIELCRGANLNLWVDYGIGYTIPRAIVDVINIFLRTFDARPIEGSGGIGSTTNILNRQEIVPNARICR